MAERTLIIIKPDAVQRHLVGLILSRFEQKGLKIVAAKSTATELTEILPSPIVLWLRTFLAPVNAFWNSVCNTVSAVCSACAIM